MNVHVHVGFNHRYHRSIRKAFELLDENAIGDVIFIRGMYGHGGRLRYDKEWRSDVSLSGGGELIDQGPHLIDLQKNPKVRLCFYIRSISYLFLGYER